MVCDSDICPTQVHHGGKIVLRSMQRAFSLVELLVVVWIIALLAALLFPVFQGAKRKGQETGCLSNQHQTGIALILYLSDYDSQYPAALDPVEHVFPTYIGPEPELVKSYFSCKMRSGFQGQAIFSA